MTVLLWVTLWPSSARSQTLPHGCEAQLERRLQESLAAQREGLDARALALAVEVSSVRPTGTLHGFIARQHHVLHQLPEALREARACLRDVPGQPPTEERAWYERLCSTLVRELEGAGVAAAPPPPVERPAYCREAEHQWGRPIVGPALLVGSGVLLAVAGGLVFYTLAKDADGRAHDIRQSEAAQQSAYDDAEGYFYGGEVGSFILGGGAVAAGVLWYVFGRVPVTTNGAGPARAALQWSVRPTAGGVMFGVGGSL